MRPRVVREKDVLILYLGLQLGLNETGIALILD